MRNCKKELLTALVSAIETAIPSRKVRTKMFDIDNASNSDFPYIYIGDVFQNEDGPKNWYRYPVEVLIQIVYKDQSSLGPLYDDQNKVLGLLTIPDSLTLINNFKVMETELISSNDTEIKIDSGTLNIGLIRIRYTIEDLN